jgi:hypothetical protein
MAKNRQCHSDVEEFEKSDLSEAVCAHLCFKHELREKLGQCRRIDRVLKWPSDFGISKLQALQS